MKKDEFSTKCNQTDHHRMSDGRQEVRPDPPVLRGSREGGWFEGRAASRARAGAVGVCAGPRF